MKSVNFQKKFEADLRKKYLPDLETEAGLVGLVGVQYDRVIVKVDSTKESKKTVYEHNGTAWVYVNKVENIEHEISFTDDHNIYITDKDRKPKLMGDVLPYEDIDDLLDKDPAIYNKLYITKRGKLYYYNSDGAYKLVSGGGGAGGTNRLADVATFAEIVTTYPKPDDWDCVVVLNDEGHDGQKTWYVFDGNTWAYQGIYFNETLVQNISDRNTRATVINSDVDYVLPFEYVVGRKHLEIYIEDELLIQDIDYIEDDITMGYVSNKIQFKNVIPKEARIVFKRKVATVEGDSRITRITGELWMKFLDTMYSDFDTKLKDTGLSAINNRVPNVTNITDNNITTFKVPKDKPIGYRVLVRKAHVGAATITISAENTSEKFTYALLTSLTLTSDGDYWELEKVTDTRWDLVGGKESYIKNTKEMFFKNYDGEAYSTGYKVGYDGSSLHSINSTSVGKFNYVTELAVSVLVVPADSWDYDYTYYIDNGTLHFYSTMTAPANEIRFKITGRWY